MSGITKLSKLFHAIAGRDWSGAQQLAREIASEEERKGHRTAAQLLRGALHHNGSRPSIEASSDQQEAHLVSDALTPVDSNLGIDSVMLRGKNRAELLDLIKEWRHRAHLERLGIRRRTKLMFHGPPGCGKTMCARALGAETSLPVYVVRFDAVIGAYLGQTALRLRELFRYAQQNAVVLLLDELDAIGRRRGNLLDVAELDRIVISLMQQLEHTTPKGFVVATSNLPGHIDDALWRRFDLVLEFPKPTSSELGKYTNNILKDMKIPKTRALLAAARQLKSYADVETLIEAEARRRALLRKS